jgi:hypothetical protein
VKRAEVMAVIQRLRLGAELHGMPMEAIEIMRGTAADLERMLSDWDHNIKPKRVRDGHDSR